MSDKHSVGVPQTADKAWVGGLLGAVSAAVVAYIASGQHVSLYGLLGVAVAGGVTWAGTYFKKNRAKVAPVERGAGEGKFIVLVAVGVALGLLVWWIVASLGHNDHNGHRGNDWERVSNVALR